MEERGWLSIFEAEHTRTVGSSACTGCLCPSLDEPLIRTQVWTSGTAVPFIQTQVRAFQTAVRFVQTAV